MSSHKSIYLTFKKKKTRLPSTNTYLKIRHLLLQIYLERTCEAIAINLFVNTKFVRSDFGILEVIKIEAG